MQPRGLNKLKQLVEHLWALAVEPQDEAAVDADTVRLDGIDSVAISRPVPMFPVVAKLKPGQSLPVGAFQADQYLGATAMS